MPIKKKPPPTPLKDLIAQDYSWYGHLSHNHVKRMLAETIAAYADKPFVLQGLIAECTEAIKLATAKLLDLHYQSLQSRMNGRSH